MKLSKLKKVMFFILFLFLFESTFSVEVYLSNCAGVQCDTGFSSPDDILYFNSPSNLNYALYFTTTAGGLDSSYNALKYNSYHLSSGTTCQVTSISASTVNVNLQRPNIAGTYYLNNIPISLLTNYYYMNTTIEYVLYKNSGEIAVSTNSVNKLVPPGGTTYSLTNPFTQSFVETTYGVGSYEVKARATPIDGKCPSVTSNSSVISSFTIATPSITGTLTASTSTSIVSGTDFTLSWSASNANSCKITESGTPMFTGLGTGTTQAISQSVGLKTYKLVCSNAQTTDVQVASVTVEVTAPVCTWSEWSPSPSEKCNGVPFQQSRTYSCGGTEETTMSVGTAYCCVPSSTNFDYSCSENYLYKRDSNCGSYISHSLCSAGCSSGACIPDADTDGFADIDLNSDGKPEDWCPAVLPLTGKENIYNGCPTEYTSLSCSGSSFFDGTNLVCNYDECSSFEEFFGCQDGDYFSFNGNQVSGVVKDSISFKPIQGSGTYICYNQNSGEDGNVGHCSLRLNMGTTCKVFHNGVKLYEIPIGETLRMYKYNKILLNEDVGSIEDTITLSNSLLSNSIKQRFVCIGQDISVNNRYSQSQLKILSGPEYDNLIRDEVTGELKVNDTITIGKLACDSTDDVCSLKVNSTSTVDVNLNEIDQTRTKEIIVIRNGENIRNDTIDISLIAMQAHKIQRFTSDDLATNFIAKSYDVMTKFNITKNLTYNSATNKTTVKIQLNDIEPVDRQNLTIYMLVEKETANSLEDITNIDNGNAEFFVVDKDPIIGWYFNESTGDEEVGFDVGGDSEGGTVIITQTPILYNEGELIINYRETNCSTDEITLFELDDLMDSKMYIPGSNKLYKVCIAYIDSSVNLYLNNPSYTKSIDVLSYENAQNGSSNSLEFSNIITMSTDDLDLYWDVKIQKENPSGNYSCIGSFDLVNQSSLFGDCGYNEDARVWIHLGNDLNPPTTTLSYPFLAHVLKVTLTAFEPSWESGVKNLTYRIVEDTEIFTAIEGDTATFQVTCPNDWNCKKTVEFYAEDNAGNIEVKKSQDLLLIDKGSACQNDCTAKPSPNRYLKECRNLNGCTFYNYNNLSIFDSGEYVASKCDYLAIGSWTSYNDTHEILCPKGPFRESKFTTERLNAIDESNCENVIKTPYPIVFDGESIIMNVISCINYEE